MDARDEFRHRSFLFSSHSRSGATTDNMSNDNMSATSSFMHRTVLKRNPTPSEAQKMNAFHDKKREQQGTAVPFATPPSNLSDVRTSDLPEDHQPPVARKARDVRTAIAGDATFQRMFETYTRMARERQEGQGNAEGNDGVVNEEEEQQQPPRGQSQCMHLWTLKGSSDS